MIYMMKIRKNILAVDGFRGIWIPEIKKLSNDPVFDNAMQVVMLHEGVCETDDPDDRGGFTKYGISLRLFTQLNDPEFDFDRDGDLDKQDLQNLTIQMAAEIYRRVFWDALGNNFHKLSEGVAIKAFDLAVNMGSAQACKLLQRSVMAVTGEELLRDGIIGTKSIKAINACDQRCLLAAYRSMAWEFYDNLVFEDMTLKKFHNGWINRALF